MQPAFGYDTYQPERQSVPVVHEADIARVAVRERVEIARARDHRLARERDEARAVRNAKRAHGARRDRELFA
jgi:hypothetical protein